MTPTQKQMIVEAVNAHGGHATFKEIKEYVFERYGRVNEFSLNCMVNLTSVNVQSRVGWPENQHCRRCVPGKGYDLFFKVARGEFVTYDLQIHGQWEIIANDVPGEPRWLVRRVPEGAEAAAASAPALAPAPVAAPAVERRPAQPAPAAQPSSPVQPPPPTHPPSPPRLPKLTVAELGELRRQIMALLDQVEPRNAREGPGGRIGRLIHEDKLPSRIGRAMSMIVEYRNWLEYEHGALTPAETKMILSGWQAIEEWSASAGLRLPAG